MESTLQLIHNELKDSREAVQAINTSITRLETLIKPLFDNGQPGLITRLQDTLKEKADADALKTLQDTLKETAAAVEAALKEKADTAAMTNLSNIVEDLKSWKLKVLGGATVLSAIGALVAEAAIRYFFH